MFINKRKLEYILVTLYVFFILYVIFQKLPEGGRWGTGFPLAMADRFLNNGLTLYSSPDEGILSTSSYFPGDVFVAIICRVIFGQYAETSMIVIGALMGAAILYMFSKIATNKKYSSWGLGLVGVVIVYYEFPMARFYLMELHPDIPALLFGTLGVFFISKYIDENKIRWVVLASVMLLGAGLFKQTAVFIYIGIGVYVFFTEHIERHKKGIILLAEFISGIGTIGIVISNKWCWLNCVTMNAKHPLMSADDFKEYFLLCLKHDWIYLCLCCCFFVLLICKKIHIETMFARLYLSVAVSWLFFNVLTSLKYGANDGNIEAAIISLMPYVEMTCGYFGEGIKKLFEKHALRKPDGLLLKNVLFVEYMIVICCVCLITYKFGYVSCRNISNYIKRLNAQNQMESWLNSNYKGEKVAGFGSYYSYYDDADIIPSTDFHVAGLYNEAHMVSDRDMYEIYKREKWALIMTQPWMDTMNSNAYPSTFSHYELLEGGGGISRALCRENLCAKELKKYIEK